MVIRPRLRMVLAVAATVALAVPLATAINGGQKLPTVQASSSSNPKTMFHGGSITTSKLSGLPALGSVQLSGPMKADPNIHYKTALASPTSTSSATVDSTNWSGYADTADSSRVVSYVQQLFTIPNVDCADSTIGSAGDALWSDWVGLDGFNDNTVEQTGVAADCTSTSAPATYFAFYEMFPDDAVTFTGVSPGDEILVIASKVATGWNLVLEDRSINGEINTVQPCPTGSTCKDASGEVITEDYNGSVADGNNLANFAFDLNDNITVHNANTTGNLETSSAWDGHQIDMVNGSDVMAAPGTLEGTGTGGDGFYVEFLRAS